MTKTLSCLLAFICLLLVTSLVLPCSHACAATYTGRVVDDAGEPIAGAVIVGQWSEEMGTLAGGGQRIKGIKETVTDSNGAWSIEGPSGVRNETLEHFYIIVTLLTGTHYVKPPRFTIFKPGYCPYPYGFAIQACKAKMKPKPTVTHSPTGSLGNGETAELPRLLDPADRKVALPYPVAGGPDQAKELLGKQKKFTDLINEERRNLGLRELNFKDSYK